MNTFNTLIATATLALASTLPFAASAQDAAQPARTADIVVAQAAATDMTEGEVRKVDKDTGKVTLKHGEIKNLDMPGMTMLFKVKDPSMLEMVKPGDKVKFKAEQAGGSIVVTEIQLAR